MKKTMIILIITLFIISACTPSNDVTGQTVKDIGEDAQTSKDMSSKDTQTVKIGIKGAEYVLNPSTVKVNTPVTLVNDGSLIGCSVHVIQKELGVNANFARNQKYIFTPTKTGTFDLACSMNMFKGKITVT